MTPSYAQDSALAAALFNIKSLTIAQRTDIKKAVLFIRQNLEPYFEFTDSFDLLWIADGIETMGEYVCGTSDQPLVLMYPNVIWEHAVSQGQSFYDEVVMTIAHELGHSVQDRVGRLTGSEENEDEAELFAHNWVRYGELCMNLLTGR